MSGNSKRRREAKAQRRNEARSSPPRGFHEVPRTETLAALSELVSDLGAGVFHVDVEHDSGCPATRSSAMRDCTCAKVNVRSWGREQ